MFNRQFFIFGASVAYGVGSTQSGWAGLLKQYVHSMLYNKDSLGEKAEVYNFAKPGAEIEFISNNFKRQLSDYDRGCHLTAFILVGLNDTKAVDSPNNYLSDKVKFQENYNILLNSLSEYFETINVLGFYDVNESKVHPKINPLDGSLSYFKNDRIREFNRIVEKICYNHSKVNFINISTLDNNWVKDCLYDDGLHPNDKGHQLIFEKLKEYISI